MKIKHVIISVCLVVLVGAGLFLYTTFGKLDEIIQASIQEYGSEMTQAEVRLTDVSLEIMEGRAAISGLYIGNPEGYQTEYAMKLDQLMVTMDLKSITSDTILIKEILINAPDLIYEKKDGVSNFDAILNNINSYTGVDPEQEQAPEEEGGPKLIIEDLYINDGNVNVSYEIMQGKTLSVGLPDIHLEDIGKEDEGASPAEVASEVMGNITSGLGTAVASITEGGGEILEKAKEGIKNVGDKIKGFFE